MESNGKVNFVVIGRIRTGTSQLCSALDSHPDILCKLELLKRGKYNDGVSKVEGYLSRQVFGDSKEAARGFKIMYHQFWGRDTPEFYWICNVLKNFNAKIIHMKRRNFLDHYLSIRLASECEIWNAWIDRRIDRHFVMLEDDTLDKYNRPITINLKRFELKAKSQSRWEQAINDMFPDNLKVYYEDTNFEQVQKWLGVEPRSISPSTVKMRTKGQRDLISNYDEVASYLNRTGRSWMLDHSC